MPTPFSHLVAVARLLTDSDVPADLRAMLSDQRPAFTLGSVAPDARPHTDDPRLTTHFYSYIHPFDKHPWLIMLDDYPVLCSPQDDAHRAFLAGYVAHLAMDEVWTEDMLKPHFANGDWGGDIKHRFFVLHAMLIDMDERDLRHIPDWAPQAIRTAEPDNWLPFIPQEVMLDWQSLIYDQIRPDGHSQTLEIFGGRVGKSAAELGALVHDPEWMQRELWDHVPRAVMAQVEATMYDHARGSLVRYLREFAHMPQRGS